MLPKLTRPQLLATIQISRQCGEIPTLRNYDLSQLNLRGADLHGVNFQGADLSQTDLCGADLRGAILSYACLYQASLRGADLRGADLNQADLVKANLTGADLQGVWLEGTILQDANLSETCLDPTNSGRHLAKRLGLLPMMPPADATHHPDYTPPLTTLAQ